MIQGIYWLDELVAFIIAFLVIVYPIICGDDLKYLIVGIPIYFLYIYWMVKQNEE